LSPDGRHSKNLGFFEKGVDISCQVWYPIKAVCDAALRLPKNLKKVQKSLDKADDPRYNKSVPQAAERVSCKLNNERTKHQTGAHEDVQLKKLEHWGSVNYPVFEQEFMKLWK
jgi:hypothetical protein